MAMFPRTVARKFSTEGICVCSTGLEIPKIQLIFSVSYFKFGVSAHQSRLVAMGLMLPSFNLILVTTIGGRPKPGKCFLLGRLNRTPLPKERYSNSLNGRGSNT